MLEKNCFVIMPFGSKKGPSGQIVDFDRVYQHLISPSIKRAGLEPIRADEISSSRIISKSMFHALAEFPYALVDGTYLNPNVYYEFGVRHSLKKAVTIAIRQRGTPIPFDLKDFRFFDYDLNGAENGEQIELQINLLSSYIRDSCRSNEIDSPVWENIQRLHVNWKTPFEIPSQKTISYSLDGMPETSVGIRTGGLDKVRDFDGWVNTENDHMLMARVVDKSVSSFVRYHGAKTDSGGSVVEDTISNALSKAVGKNKVVKLGQVFQTGPGELRRKYNVKRIFHVATVSAQPVQGFRPGPDPDIYVQNVLREIEFYNRRVRFRAKAKRITSALIPIFGTGSAKGSPEEITAKLVRGVANFFTEFQGGKATSLRRIYFLAYSAKEAFPMERSFQSLVLDGLIGDRTGPLFESSPSNL